MGYIMHVLCPFFLIFKWYGEENWFPHFSIKYLFSKLSVFAFVLKHGKQQQILSHSPKTKTTGFSITTSQGSPSDSAASNRWYKPEIDTPSTIRSIQIEERAMKDLKRFYSSVKIVKNQSWIWPSDEFKLVGPIHTLFLGSFLQLPVVNQLYRGNTLYILLFQVYKVDYFLNPFGEFWMTYHLV